MAQSRIEELLEALVNGEYKDIKPQSREEEYLLALIKGDNIDKSPQSRIEAYLSQLCKSGMSGGGITPTGTIEITENGTHDVTNYASANVNVASSGGGSGDLDALIDGSITELTSNTEIVRASCFNALSSLKKVSLPNVTTLSNNVFSSCSALETVNLPLVTSIGSNCFYYATSFKNADFPLVERISSGSFNYCRALVSVNLPKITIIPSQAFHTCTALTSVVFPMVTEVVDSAFNTCNGLVKVDLPKANKIGSQAFYNCKVLDKLIIRSETVCTLSSKSAFTNTPIAGGTGYVYVPRALLSDTDETMDYRMATNWTTLLSNNPNVFRALEDYTVDGTITGELDETKI